MNILTLLGTVENVYYLVLRIKNILELHSSLVPDTAIVVFGSSIVDIFEVNDIMSSKGMHLNALQRLNRYVFSNMRGSEGEQRGARKR